MPADAPRTLFVAQCEPPAAREAEFHDWYDKVHAPDAFANGSFTGLSRYRAAGPGAASARFLALWEGDYETEAEAWGYIRPRAHALHAAGRIDDISSVRFALMMFRTGPATTGWLAQPTSLTTVQNDWRQPDASESGEAWLRRIGFDRRPGPSWLYSSDPAGHGGGYHLALFAQQCSVADAARLWTGSGTPGSSPTPPYRRIFAESDVEAKGAIDRRAVADAWVMHWEPIAPRD